MNIVVISGCEVVDRHIISRLRERWPDINVVRPIWGSRERPFAHGVVKAARSPIESVRRVGYRKLRRRQQRALKSLLPGTPPLSVIGPEPVLITDLNRPAGIRAIERLQPDLLVLSGAPILRDDLLAVPAVGTVNLHFGIAPQYRGEHTLFHALRRRDYDCVGVTIHGVDRGIDTGPIIIQARPRLERDDGETTLFARCAQLGADLLVECLDVIECTGRVTGLAQSDPGQLYLRSDRRILRHDLLDVVNRKLLGRRPPRSPGSVSRYYDSSIPSS